MVSKKPEWAFMLLLPSADASRGVQREEGFKDAETIAAFLQSKEMQDKTKNGVIWIDEAGMVGNKTMNQIIDVAKEQNARILLTGDVKQHNSVERGDALRIIQDFGGVKPAYITTIRRQQNEQYKQAIKAISNDKLDKGYKLLDDFGAIKESQSFTEMTQKASKEYADAIQKKEGVLVVAPTHAQGKATTEAIRSELKERNLLSNDEKERLPSKPTYPIPMPKRRMLPATLKVCLFNFIKLPRGLKPENASMCWVRTKKAMF